VEFPAEILLRLGVGFQGLIKRTRRASGLASGDGPALSYFHCGFAAVTDGFSMRFSWYFPDTSISFHLAPPSDSFRCCRRPWLHFACSHDIWFCVDWQPTINGKLIIQFGCFPPLHIFRSDPIRSDPFKCPAIPSK